MKYVNHRGIRKRLLAVLLCAVLCVSGAQPMVQPVWAVEQSAAETTFATNNQEEDAFRFSLKDGAFLVESVPTAGGYQYIWVQIDGEGEFIFPVSSPEAVALPKQDGVYHIQVYLGKQRYETFDGPCMYGERVGVLIQNGMASFVKSPVYDSNRRLYEQASASDTALGYYTQPSHWVESNASEIKALANQIASAQDSDFEKIRKVHDWVANNIWYDYDAYYSGRDTEVDARKVLKTKRTVCSGYANLTAALLRSLGIPTKIMIGYSLGIGTSGRWTDAAISGSQSNHAWNEAYADDRWMILDTTWDSDNRYEKGVFSRGTGMTGRLYFDPTLEFFSTDHRIMPEDEYDRWEREQAFQKALSVSKTSLTLKKGKTKQLSVKTSKRYIDLKDAKITYSSNKTKVASVSSSGKIKAKTIGNAVITTKVKLEGITLKFRTSVKVKK